MFKFIKIDEDDAEEYNQFPRHIEMQFNSDTVTWDQLLEGFTQFLRGCGYDIPLTAYPTILTEDGEDMRNTISDTYALYSEDDDEYC